MMIDRRFSALMLAPVAALSLSGCGINSVPAAQEEAKAKWADVQTQYQRRADLIPNLVNTVKGYATQEKSVLVEVTEARAKATSIQLSANDLQDPAKMKAFADAQSQLSGSLSRLLVASENYPELKSSDQFMALQSQLEGTENRIAISRRDYNEAVRSYNTLIRTFPSAIGAKVFHGAQPMAPFEASAAAANAPTVTF